jgi:hypothetical protein
VIRRLLAALRHARAGHRLGCETCAGDELAIRQFTHEIARECPRCGDLEFGSLECVRREEARARFAPRAPETGVDDSYLERRG